MKNLVIYVLVLFLLALNCMALSPVQLTGSSGKAILNNLGANSPNQITGATFAGNATNNVTNNTTSNATNLKGINSLQDLWGWGEIPEGYSRDKSGKLVRNSTQTEWRPSI
ncbi:MAG: hypothetical protein LUO89_11775 [Methanothrix sp.]|nr:hypothetical protein [Methanothrix sp.]